MKNMGMNMPEFIYGTAWKEGNTADLTKKAVLAGYRAIDTANQKKHYREDFVGNALVELVQQGVQREALFLQSKFTYVQGQDHRLPYDPRDGLSAQVKASFASSLKNLHTTYLDSYLLHGPSSRNGIQAADWEVWRAIEDLCKSGQTKMIGISNVNVRQLEELTQNAEIKPMMVQNRCYANQGWDRSVREFCLANQITYQGFSLLTANPQILASSSLVAIAQRLGVTPQQVVFRFAKQLGILPITGTSSEQHMREDLRISEFELSSNDMIALSSFR